MDRREFITACAAGFVGIKLPKTAFSNLHAVNLVPLTIESAGLAWNPPAAKRFPEEISRFYLVSVKAAEPVRIKLKKGYSAGDALDEIRKIGPGHTIGLASAPPRIAGKDSKPIGVSGYAELNGSAAITTTYWRARNKPAEISHTRTLEIILHELGHNFGAADCQAKGCTMYNDPTGKKLWLDQPTGKYCEYHQDALKNWLR